MEEFFNKFSDAILEIFTIIFSYVPFQVFFLTASLLIAIVCIIRFVSFRREDR